MNENPESAKTLQVGILWQAFVKLQFADQMFSAAVQHFHSYHASGTGFREDFIEATQSYQTVLYADLLPWPIPALIGAGIHSLRSSLDTAISVLIARAGGKPDSRINFPVHGTERDLRESFEPGKTTCPDCKKTRPKKATNHEIRSLLPDLERIIMTEFMPWEDGNYALWALSKIDNIQKHRMLVPVALTASGNVDFRSQEGTIAANNIWQTFAGQSVLIAQSREPLIITNTPGTMSELNFPDNIPFRGKPVFEVLTELFKLVNGILVTLQSHFERGEGVIERPQQEAT